MECSDINRVAIDVIISSISCSKLQNYIYVVETYLTDMCHRQNIQLLSDRFMGTGITPRKSVLSDNGLRRCSVMCIAWCDWCLGRSNLYRNCGRPAQSAVSRMQHWQNSAFGDPFSQYVAPFFFLNVHTHFMIFVDKLF